MNVHEALESGFGAFYHLICDMRNNIESKLAELDKQRKNIIDSAKSSEIEAQFIKVIEKWKMQSNKGVDFPKI